MSQKKNQYQTHFIALLISTFLADISQGADCSEQEKENTNNLAMISIASPVSHQSREEEIALLKDGETSDALFSPPISSSSSSFIQIQSISTANQTLDTEASANPPIIVEVSPSTLAVPSIPLNLHPSSSSEVLLVGGEKKDEEQKKQGFLTYTAKIDLEKITIPQLTQLVSMHYEFGIPLSFDFSEVAEKMINDLSLRLEVIAKNATHRLNHDRLRILSIDGGGVRGIIAAMFLVEIEKRTGKPIRDLFDIIVGTSTGGILAAGLSFYSALDLLKLYKEKSQFLFSKKLQYIGWYGAKYSDVPMVTLLKEKFGERSLKDLPIDTLFTTYSFSDHTGCVFSSEKAKICHDENFFLWEILRASTAAPTIFEPYQIGTKILCDGGLFLNNPVMLGIIHGMEKYGKLPHEMEVVSLGTGYAVEVQTLSGYAGLTKVAWVEELLNAFLNGNSQHYLAQYLTKAYAHHHGTGGVLNYHRFTVDLQKQNIDIDNYEAKNLQTLEEIAQNKIKLWDKKIEDLCGVLMQKSTI
jgi:patatin-like phospholipase/acyl hydrolase